MGSPFPSSTLILTANSVEVVDDAKVDVDIWICVCLFVRIVVEVGVAKMCVRKTKEHHLWAATLCTVVNDAKPLAAMQCNTITVSTPEPDPTPPSSSSS